MQIHPLISVFEKGSLVFSQLPNTFWLHSCIKSKLYWFDMRTFFFSTALGNSFLKHLNLQIICIHFIYLSRILHCQQKHFFPPQHQVTFLITLKCWLFWKSPARVRWSEIMWLGLCAPSSQLFSHWKDYSVVTWAQLYSQSGTCLLSLVEWFTWDYFVWTNRKLELRICE